MSTTRNKKDNNSIKDKTDTRPKFPQLEEGYVGRDWKKFFTIIAFFFILLLVWYTLKAISME